MYSIIAILSLSVALGGTFGYYLRLISISPQSSGIKPMTILLFSTLSLLAISILTTINIFVVKAESYLLDYSIDWISTFRLVSWGYIPMAIVHVVFFTVLVSSYGFKLDGSLSQLNSYLPILILIWLVGIGWSSHIWYGAFFSWTEADSQQSRISSLPLTILLLVFTLLFTPMITQGLF
jgi:hypothetical protein